MYLLEKAILWIEDSYVGQEQQFEVKNVSMKDLFIKNAQLFTS